MFLQGDMVSHVNLSVGLLTFSSTGGTQCRKTFNAFLLFQVLRFWRNRSGGVRVKAFIERLVSWQQSGYVSPDVWENLGDIVDPRLLPAEIPRDPSGKAEGSVVVLRTSLFSSEGQYRFSYTGRYRLIRTRLIRSST